MHVHECKLKLTLTATSLVSRTFGTWTLLSAALRLACAADFYNKTVFWLTFGSFAIVQGYFAGEVFVYKTAELSTGVVLPFIISGASLAAFAYVGLSDEYSRQCAAAKKKSE